MTSMHNPPTRSRRRLLAFSTAMALATCLDAQTPIAVSPGAAGAAEALGTSCPTFSWSGVPGATGYELLLYRVGDNGSLGVALQRRVPGDARAWTPSASTCPEPGYQYAWVVRASAGEEAGAWSEPLLFDAPSSPTADEVRRALETLRRYQRGAIGEALADEGALARTEIEEPVAHSAHDGANPRRGQAVAALPGAGLPVAPLSTTTVGSQPSPRDISAPGNYSLTLAGDIDLGGAIFREGYPFLHNDGGAAFGNVGLGLLAMISLTPGDPLPDSGFENTAIGGRALRDATSARQNTAVGFDALRDTTTGNVNTAVGARALRNNTSGFSNTAVGERAARSSTTSSYNTAVGRAALYSNQTGTHNTAVGYRALVASTASPNTAVGSLALTDNTTGSLNTAVGRGAMRRTTTGSSNTAIGNAAMYSLTTGTSNVAIGESAGFCWTSSTSNITIGASVTCSGADNGVIRIGNLGHSSAFIGGIHGATVSGGAQVFVNSSNQLGTSTSSARFKRDIDDLEGVSDRLLALRPVSFRYKDEIVEPEDGDNPLEYGLIAEEVAEVFPELVIYDREGEPYTVRYHLLAPLLLAEVQRQAQALRDRDTEIVGLRDEVGDLWRRLEAPADPGSRPNDRAPTSMKGSGPSGARP